MGYGAFTYVMWCCVFKYFNIKIWFPLVIMCLEKTTVKLMLTLVALNEISTKLAEEAQRG